MARRAGARQTIRERAGPRFGAAAPGGGRALRDGLGPHVNGQGGSGRKAADVDAASRAGARRQRQSGREPRFDVHPLRKRLRSQQLQQPEEPVCIVLERRRAQQQYVASQCRNRRHRTVSRLPRVPGRPPQPVGLVHHEQVDARSHCLTGEFRPCDQRLERNYCTAVSVKRVEPGAEVARNIREACRIQQRKDLVILAPQLAQPLHRQRLGCDHHAPVDRLRVQQPIHDQRGFDGFAEADFVGEQPSYREARGCTLGDVQLMREQSDAAAQEGPETTCLTGCQQVQDIDPGQEVLGLVDIARGQPLNQRPFACLRLLVLGTESIAVRRQPQGGPIAGEADDHHASFNRRDLSGAELGIEAVGQVVADGPCMHAFDLTGSPPYEARVRSRWLR